MAVDNAKLETAVGSCGLGSCRSSCCEEPEAANPPQLKQIEIAIRAEMVLLQKMLLDKMIAALKLDGQIPQISVHEETSVAQTPKQITIRV